LSNKELNLSVRLSGSERSDYILIIEFPPPNSSTTQLNLENPPNLNTERIIAVKLGEFSIKEGDHQYYIKPK